MDKKLYRSRDNRVIAGICGGLGEYFDIDPVIIRALFVVAAFGGGFGLLTYIVLWMAIPEEGGDRTTGTEASRHKGDGREGGNNTLAWTLLIFGAILLFNNYFPRMNMFRLWPVILIAAAIAVLKRPSHE